MVTLRLVGGTDVTGVSRRRPRGKQGAKNSSNTNQTPIPVGAILAAQIEAHEAEVVRSPRRRDPLKMMKADARTVLQSITPVGTDLSGVPGIEMSIEPSEAAALRLEEKAREALRNLKLPGQEKTVGELRDELSKRCRKRYPRSSRQRAMSDRFHELVDSVGIFWCYEQPDTRSWDLELRCVVGWPDDLIAAHPEFKPFAFVLEGLEF